MKRIPTTILATAWLVLILAGQCRATSGNELLEECQLYQRASVDDPKLTRLELLKAGKCRGTVDGIVFTGQLLFESYRFCAPEGVTMDQAVRVLIKFLDAHPELTHMSGEAVAITAFHDAWLCN
jgi:hypothetical protein